MINESVSFNFFDPQYVIRAARDGVVEKIYHQPGDTVAKGTVLVHLKEE